MRSSITISLTAALMILSVSMSAQSQNGGQNPQNGYQQPPQGGVPPQEGSMPPDGQRPEPPQMKSPAEMAKELADTMQAEVGLDSKQYKKVYKLFKKDFEYRQQARQNNAPGGGMPPQGGMGGPGGGMPPQGGGMGGPGGGMPPQGGGMGGSGGGMPPQGGGMGGPGGGMPPQGGPGMGPGADPITQDYLEEQDKKLQKILSAEQYAKWRSKHPAEYLELPPIELQ